MTLTKLKFSAASCIHGKDDSHKLSPCNISVLLGAYDIMSKNEMEVQQRDVQEIHIHPEWNVFSYRYDANLAILLLSEKVLFTDYVRPVCIPAYDSVIDNLRGSVVGWGLALTGMKQSTAVLQRSSVSSLDNNYCIRIDPDTAFILSPRTFCGRNDDGFVSIGDSGVGLFVQNRESIWMQRGIVSAVRTNSTGYVLADAVVVYTNVPKFKNWIADTVSQSGATVGEAQTQFAKLNLECLFAYDSITYK